jgi:peptidoglycan/LPS O-acetylase OafA/YrhL
LGFAVNLVLRHFGAHKFAGSTALAVVGGFFVANAVYYALFNAGLERVAANPLIGVAAALAIYLIELPRADESAPRPSERYGPLRLATLRFWTWMGFLSYGIYLWHLPILILGGPLAIKIALMLMDHMGVEAGWQRSLIFHAVQVPMVLGVTLLVSWITFFAVEVRFRPHLYKWDAARYSGRRYGGGARVAVARHRR